MDRTEIAEAAAAAVQTAFEEMCQTPVVPGPVAESTNEIVAVIALKRTPPGKLCLAFPAAVLETLARRYLPEEPPSEELFRDAAGEFANVVAGQLKTCLKGTPFHFDLSTPTVGDATGPFIEPIQLGFECDAGTFRLDVDLP
jgi:CheY-specific phosphatase CheX